MNIRDINVDYKGVSMCHWNLELIKINNLNQRTPICKMAYNKFPYIITVNFLNTWSNEWTEDCCYFREGFDWWHFCSCNISQIKLLYIIVSEDNLNLHHLYLGWEVYLGDELQDVKSQVLLDQVWNQFFKIYYLLYIPSA